MSYLWTTRQMLDDIHMTTLERQIQRREWVRNIGLSLAEFAMSYFAQPGTIPSVIRRDTDAA